MRAPDPRAPGWLVLAVFGDRRHPDPGVDAARSTAAWGVLAAVVAFTVLAGLRVVGTPPFDPPDETAHVAYAFALLDGRIPHIAEFPEELPIPGMRDGLSTWTANHPPGPYLLLAVPLWLGQQVDMPLAGFWAARLLNVAGAAVALVLGARIAATVLPHRPRVVVGATAVAALIPYHIDIAGTAYTDGLALAPTVALLAVAVEVLVRGPSRGRLAAMVVLSAVVALCRAPAVVLILLAGTAWGVAVLLHDDRALGRRLLRGVGGASLLGIAAFAAAGWFYLGNIATYGDPTGSRALFELHDRSPRAPVSAILTSSHDYWYYQRQLWAKVEGLPGYMDQVRAPFVPWFDRITPLVLLTGVGVGVVHAVRTRLRGQAGVVAAWVLLTVWWWALMAMMAQFVSGGGAPHARYLWPALPGSVLLLAVGLDAWRLPVGAIGRRVGRPALQQVRDVPVGLWLVVGCLLVAHLHGFPRAMAIYGLVGEDRDWVQAALGVLVERQIPAPGWLALAAGAALVGAMATVAWTLWATPVRTPAVSGGVPVTGVAGADVAAPGDEADPAPTSPEVDVAADGGADPAPAQGDQAEQDHEPAEQGGVGR